MKNIDLTKPEHAYFFGFIQGDGHLHRSKDKPNKGKLTIELNLRDEDILKKFQLLFPRSSISYRHRDTNFSENFDAVIWRMCQQDFREEIELLGVPVGKKSLIVKPPMEKYSEIDYWRGFIDADGSIGITADNLPYISLITTSQFIAEAFEEFIFKITGKRKILNRNKRDQAYNITLFRENASKVASILYYDKCLGLNRKIIKAKEVEAWIRPSNMKIVMQKKWKKEEDNIVLSTNELDASRILNRSLSSIKNRKFRLKNVLTIKQAYGSIIQ